MSVPKGFLPFHPASKLLQNFLNLLTRRSYASSSVWSIFTIASSFIVLAGYILCTNYYPLPILFGLLNARKHSALASATLSVHPHYNAPASITFDASDLAVGAVLEQFIDHEWRPIGFFSRKLQPAETRYSTFDRELLGVYLAIRHFRWFIEGRVFHVYTDHKPLNFAISSGSTQPSPQQIRQLAFISEFTTDLQHVMGKNNAVADAFSRIQINYYYYYWKYSPQGFSILIYK
jgi:hypothetical protein